jgi:ATP-dependent RNA circularization protein (DNA/RNA ligase family)
MEYHKIDTLFERDGKFVVDTSQPRHPVIATIREWDVTEKVDGTNIRVMMSESGDVTFGGRTDNAQIPADLIKYLVQTFTPSKMVAAFTRDGEPLPSVVLYGEGYGAGIQKGGYYRPDKSFRLFDVLVSGKWWLNWSNVCDVASKLSIKTVPRLGRWTLDEIVERVRAGIPSMVAYDENGSAIVQAEGIVARPIETLFDKRGKRLIIKLKTKDFGVQRVAEQSA